MRKTKNSPEPERSEITPVLEILFKQASSYLENLDSEPVRYPGAEEAADRFDGPLPEVGTGAVSALQTLIQEGAEAALNSSGPRFFHFVIGGFDPIEKLADLAERYGTWLHVDGAFGLFARLSPKTKHLTKGVEKADSITVDGHKWLNVPYDAGFSFVRDRSLLSRTFAYSADYLPDPNDPRPNMGTIGPESSRRARSLAVWTTLKAYGQTGYRNMVERHLALAQHLAKLIDDAPELERLAEVPLNIVCFRYNPGNWSEAELNRLNEQLGEALLEDGRVYAGTTVFEGRTALRPAIVNWRTREEDINVFIRVVRELGQNIVRNRDR